MNRHFLLFAYLSVALVSLADLHSAILQKPSRKRCLTGERSARMDISLEYQEASQSQTETPVAITEQPANEVEERPVVVTEDPVTEDPESSQIQERQEANYEMADGEKRRICIEETLAACRGTYLWTTSRETAYSNCDTEECRQFTYLPCITGISGLPRQIRDQNAVCFGSITAQEVVESSQAQERNQQQWADELQECRHRNHARMTECRIREIKENRPYRECKRREPDRYVSICPRRIQICIYAYFRLNRECIRIEHSRYRECITKIKRICRERALTDCATTDLWSIYLEEAYSNCDTEECRSEAALPCTNGENTVSQRIAIESNRCIYPAVCSCKIGNQRPADEVEENPVRVTEDPVQSSQAQERNQSQTEAPVAVTEQPADEVEERPVVVTEDPESSQRQERQEANSERADDDCKEAFQDDFALFCKLSSATACVNLIQSSVSAFEEKYNAGHRQQYLREEARNAGYRSQYDIANVELQTQLVTAYSEAVCFNKMCLKERFSNFQSERVGPNVFKATAYFQHACRKKGALTAQCVSEQFDENHFGGYAAASIFLTSMKAMVEVTNFSADKEAVFLKEAVKAVDKFSCAVA